MGPGDDRTASQQQVHDLELAALRRQNDGRHVGRETGPVVVERVKVLVLEREEQKNLWRVVDGIPTWIGA